MYFASFRFFHLILASYQEVSWTKILSIKVKCLGAECT